MDTKWLRNSLVYLIILVAVIALFITVSSGASDKEGTTIPMNEVAAGVRDNTVRKITVTEDKLTVEKADGKRYTARKEHNATVTQALELGVPVVVALFLVQRLGLFTLAAKLFRALFAGRFDALVGGAVPLDRAVRRLYRRRRAVLACFLWQLAGWCAGTGAAFRSAIWCASGARCWRGRCGCNRSLPSPSMRRPRRRVSGIWRATISAATARSPPMARSAR